MFGYMTTDYSRVEMTDTQEIEVESKYTDTNIQYYNVLACLQQIFINGSPQIIRFIYNGGAVVVVIISYGSWI